MHDEGNLAAEQTCTQASDPMIVAGPSNLENLPGCEDNQH
jgi:hypothetical protein